MGRVRVTMKAIAMVAGEPDRSHVGQEVGSVHVEALRCRDTVAVVSAAVTVVVVVVSMMAAGEDGSAIFKGVILCRLRPQIVSQATPN